MTREAAPEVDLDVIRKVVSIAAPQAVAWRVFTERMGAWWPLMSHKIGRAKAVDAVIEPHVGGRWYERGEDGSACDWGRVLVWEPSSRLVLSWQISADWAYASNLKTEIEVRFIAESANVTRVELTHSGLDQYGDRRDQMRGTFESEGGWSGLLAAFAACAAVESA